MDLTIKKIAIVAANATGFNEKKVFKLSKLTVYIESIQEFMKRYAPDFERKDVFNKLFSVNNIEFAQEIFRPNNISSKGRCSIEYHSLSEALNSQFLRDELTPDYILIFNYHDNSCLYLNYTTDAVLKRLK